MKARILAMLAILLALAAIACCGLWRFTQSLPTIADTTENIPIGPAQSVALRPEEAGSRLEFCSAYGEIRWEDYEILPGGASVKLPAYNLSAEEYQGRYDETHIYN